MMLYATYQTDDETTADVAEGIRAISLFLTETAEEVIHSLETRNLTWIVDDG